MPGVFDRLQAELNSRERVDGINAADLLDLSPELRRTVQLIMRRKQMSLAEIILELDMTPSEAKKGKIPQNKNTTTSVTWHSPMCAARFRRIY